jgi:hypothetical protein
VLFSAVLVWPEAFGLIVVKAMLRGIRVMASNAGGVVEAKLGGEYALPMHPIDCYEKNFDSRNSRLPLVPEQYIAQWQAVRSRKTAR